MFRPIQITVLYIMLSSCLKANAQIPKDVPHPSNNTPLDFSKPEDVIIYIVLPLVFIVLYFIGRRYSRKKK